MNAPIVKSHFYDFRLPTLDPLVQVEEADRSVVIRATRDTFSEERKTCFLHELAAEGFIRDEFRWLSLAVLRTTGGGRWLIGRSCFAPDPARLARSRRSMVRLISGVALGSLAMICLVFLFAAK